MPGNKAAIGQHYNAASDRYISHDGVVHALAEAAGVEANIVHYDTKAVSLAKVPHPLYYLSLACPHVGASCLWQLCLQRAVDHCLATCTACVGNACVPHQDLMPSSN